MSSKVSISAQRTLRSTDSTSHYFSNDCTKIATKTVLKKSRMRRNNIDDVKQELDSDVQCVTENVSQPAETVEMLKKRKIAVKERTKEENLSCKDVQKWEPIDWKMQLKNIEKMREKRDAPVDSMGCEAIADGKADVKVFNRFCKIIRGCYISHFGPSNHNKWFRYFATAIFFITRC